jgi:hypothetical protein
MDLLKLVVDGGVRVQRVWAASFCEAEPAEFERQEWARQTTWPFWRLSPLPSRSRDN